MPRPADRSSSRDQLARVKHSALLVSILALAGAISAAEPRPATGDDLLQSLQQWALENLDDRVLSALEQVDQDRARTLFAEMQRRLEGSLVYDLGALRQTASGLVPLLEQFEETIPYAVWLRSHLDYLEAAEELRRQAPAAPPPKRGAPAPLPPPTPKLQRSVWDRQLSKRPLPPRAQSLVPRLRPIFTSEKVPPQLVWVAEVESSFDPRARSPAGAAGLFQLMKPTAKSLGLSTWFPDERLTRRRAPAPPRSI